MHRHRLRLFDAVVTPTMNCAFGTWTLTEEHERMILSGKGLVAVELCNCWHTVPPAVFLVPLAPFVFVAQNQRIQLTSEFREFTPATACV